MSNRDIKDDMYPPNSAKSKNIKPVVKGKVSVKEKSTGRKILDSFAVEDTKTIGWSILDELIIPTIKDLLFDIFTGGLSMRFYGGNKGHRGGYRTSRFDTGHRDYQSITYRRGRDRGYERERPIERKESGNEFEFETRAEAAEVLRHMMLILEQYEVVSVDDLYELMDITGTYIDSEWGWTNLAKADIYPYKQGWVLSLPKAKSIK